MIDREAQLQADFEALGAKLLDAEGSAAAAIARERRLMGAELERIGVPKDSALVDDLASRRASTGARRASSRSSKSG